MVVVRRSIPIRNRVEAWGVSALSFGCQYSKRLEHHYVYSDSPNYVSGVHWRATGMHADELLKQHLQRYVQFDGDPTLPPRTRPALMRQAGVVAVRHSEIARLQRVYGGEPAGAYVLGQTIMAAEIPESRMPKLSPDNDEALLMVALRIGDGDLFAAMGVRLPSGVIIDAAIQRVDAVPIANLATEYPNAIML